MVGIIDDFGTRTTLDYKTPGDVILLIGEQQNDIASSEYLHKIKGVEYSPAPHFELDEEFAVQKFVWSIIKEKLIKSAHDISEGGLVVTLLEKGFNRGLGFDVSANSDIRLDAYWLGEAQGRIIVTATKEQAEAIKHKGASNNIPVTVLGAVTRGNIKVNGEGWGNITEWKEKYDNAIGNLLKASAGEIIELGADTAPMEVVG
jgi:phosphoribosylformylglycinamidine synthase